MILIRVAFDLNNLKSFFSKSSDRTSVRTTKSWQNDWVAFQLKINTILYFFLKTSPIRNEHLGPNQISKVISFPEKNKEGLCYRWDKATFPSNPQDRRSIRQSPLVPISMVFIKVKKLSNTFVKRFWGTFRVRKSILAFPGEPKRPIRTFERNTYFRKPLPKCGFKILWSSKTSGS